MKLLGTLGIATGLMLLPSLHALCSYKGKMYAKTTVAEEFADSQWVVRAKVIAADNHWSDEDDSWTIYHLQVREAYKGKPPLRIHLFTYRDSGGFYLDKGTFNDLGGEYLLFLDQIDSGEKVPQPARRATEVNYACGQSEEWSRVTTSKKTALKALAHGKPMVYTAPLPTDERLSTR